jgi:hypothetical protein
MDHEIYNKGGVKAGLEVEERESYKDPGSDKLLCDVAKKMAPGHNQHIGSAALHVYADTIKGQINIICQTPLGDTQELLANEAVKELAKKMMNFYGRKVSHKRDETPWEEQ